MSSRANHAKRSHRSNNSMGSVYNAHARKAYYSQDLKTIRKNSLFARLLTNLKSKKGVAEQ